MGLSGVKTLTTNKNAVTSLTGLQVARIKGTIMKITKTKTRSGEDAIEIEWLVWTDEVEQKQDELLSQGFTLGNVARKGDIKFSLFFRDGNLTNVNITH